MDDDRIRETDRLIDEFGAGGTPPRAVADDPLWALLAEARAELDRDMPAAPDVTGSAGDAGDATVVPLAAGRRRRTRRRLLRHTGRAAATGGLSVTGMVVAGGVAAALAVGGFSVAAVNGGIPGIGGGSDVADEQMAGDEGSSTSGSTTTGPVDTSRAPSGPAREPGTSDRPEAPARPGDPDRPSTGKTPADPGRATPTTPAPVDGSDGGMVIAGGEDGTTGGASDGQSDGQGGGAGMTALMGPAQSGSPSSSSESSTPAEPTGETGTGAGKDPGGAVTLREPKEADRGGSGS
jgi:hypothetical protein